MMMIAPTAQSEEVETTAALSTPSSCLPRAEGEKIDRGVRNETLDKSRSFVSCHVLPGPTIMTADAASADGGTLQLAVPLSSCPLALLVASSSSRTTGKWEEVRLLSIFCRVRRRRREGARTR